MRVGLLIDLYNIDVFDPSLPNPGIGGSQYASLCLAELLAGEIDLTVFTDRKLRFDGIRIEPTSKICELTEEDILIISVANFNEGIDKSRTRIIAWAHNTMAPAFDRLAVRADRIVVISGAQYDLLRWHQIRDKMCVIPHPFDPFMFKYEPYSSDYIIYLGALVQAKGFHYYAKAMPAILKNRQTKLLVIGGTQTYGRQGEGRLGVTSSEYENQFWHFVKPYVECGQIEFLGNMGPERFEIISKAKLALTNPTGASETFCISNYECMSLGVPVIGGFHKGMTETLFPDKKLHLSRPSQIEAKVKYLLDSPAALSGLRPAVRAFVEDKAKLKAVQNSWKRVISGDLIPHQPLSKPYFCDNKIPIWLLSKVLRGLTFREVEKYRNAFKAITLRRRALGK